jgi:hypothetical protein
MKSIDIKSVIIGVLGTILVFVSIGATDKNLGDITVTSIYVVDEDGKPAVGIGTNENGGMLIIYSADDQPVVGLMAHYGGGMLGVSRPDGEAVAIVSYEEGLGGNLSIYSADGETAAILQSSKSGGVLDIKNKHGKQTSYLGTAEGGGFLSTYNADGKKTSYLGTGENGSGILTIQNMDGELIAGFGSSPDNGKDGAAILFDRYGDIGWTASGKK